MEDDDPFMTVKEVSRTLRISEMWIRRAFEAGDIPGIRAGRTMRVLRAFVVSIIRRCEAGEQVVVEEYGRRWKARETAALSSGTALTRTALPAAVAS